MLLSLCGSFNRRSYKAVLDAVQTPQGGMQMQQKMAAGVQLPGRLLRQKDLRLFFCVSLIQAALNKMQEFNYQEDSYDKKTCACSSVCPEFKQHSIKCKSSTTRKTPTTKRPALVLLCVPNS